MLLDCIAHGAKHYYAYGTGLRLLCDVAAYLSQTQEMNWSYINSRLQTLDFLTFEQQLKNLYYEIKDLQSLSEQSGEMLKTLISAGTYGHMARGIDNRIKQIKASGQQHGKMIYLKERLFMNSADLALRYPRLSRIWGINKLLIILRMLSAICFSSRRIFKEFGHTALKIF